MFFDAWQMSLRTRWYGYWFDRARKRRCVVDMAGQGRTDGLEEVEAGTKVADLVAQDLT